MAEYWLQLATANSHWELFLYSRTVHLDIIKVLSPTDGQENCFNSLQPYRAS